MSTAYLTKEGFDKLQEELDHLRRVRRQEVANRLHDALEDGDSGIDADAEIDAARNEQAFVEGRIREIETILSNAKIIEGSGGDKEVVDIGSKVTIQEEGIEPECYTIVGAVETNPINGRISNESPLGKALMSHSIGDRVTVKAPSGAFVVTILKVE